MDGTANRIILKEAPQKSQAENIGNSRVNYHLPYPSVTNVFEAGLEETKDLVSATARAAGLNKEAEGVERCGKKYAVSRCTKCGERIGHPYHCNQGLCPTCYYRNLFRFMNRHRDSWDKTLGFVIVDVDYGSFREYEMEDGMARAKLIHEDLFCRFPFLKGGVYHVSLRWNETYHHYTILYHYFLNADVTYAMLIMWALNGQASVDSHTAFEDYDRAQRYFIRKCCQYPADILLDVTKVRWYLSFMKRRKLIQGFRGFYRMTGGKNKGTRKEAKNLCPICGSKLEFVGFTDPRYAWWDSEHRCYHVDPGAPGL